MSFFSVYVRVYLLNVTLPEISIAFPLRLLVFVYYRLVLVSSLLLLSQFCHHFFVFLGVDHLEVFLIFGKMDYFSILDHIYF